MSVQYGHDGQHHGVGTPECPTDLHHHHNERCVSPLVERRQRAREAAFDAPNGPAGGDIEPAIETATRVRITPEIAEAACAVAGIGPGNADRMKPIIVAAFVAAGFEVEE